VLALARKAIALDTQDSIYLLSASLQRIGIIVSSAPSQKKKRSPNWNIALKYKHSFSIDKKLEK
jgi:hypothetical protein